MKKIYDEFLKWIDGKRLMKHTEELWRREFGQTSENHRQAAEYVYDLMIAEGIPNAELNFFSADGKAVYHDCIMPLGWKASMGKLTLLPGGGGGSEDLVADYQSHPFSLVKGSVSTPAGGKIVRIMTEQQFLAGHDAKESLVILEPSTRMVLSSILDRGAIGYITDGIGARYKYPDAIPWCNAVTENNGWHVFADERDFICWSVSPRIGDQIRHRANTGSLIARVESDAQRYIAQIPVVTSLIPGRRKEEILIFGHMFEPLTNDDCHGISAGIETARVIMSRGTPEFSIRLAFTMELYGYTAYFASRGNFLGNEIIGGCNFDVSGCVKGGKVKCMPSPFGAPFYGNYILEQLIDELKNVSGSLDYSLGTPRYFDDNVYSDSTIGVGALWPMQSFDFAHSSVQTMEVIDEETYVNGTAFNAALVYASANPKQEYLDQALEISLRHLEIEREKIRVNPYGSDAARLTHLLERERRNIHSFSRSLDPDCVAAAVRILQKRYDELSVRLNEMDPDADETWRKYASKIVLKRATTGFPHNLAKLPKEKRCRLPEGIIYGNLSHMLSNMDGKKDVATLLRESEYEYKQVDARKASKYVKSLNFLADSGYLEVIQRPELAEPEIVAALQKLGIAEGDTLLIHSSASNCGYIQGGSSAIIRALQETVGDSGTLLFPSFTRPYMYLNALNTAWNFRPYDANDMNQIVTGQIPQVALSEFGALRSAHITHSWAGLGKHTEFCLSSHGKYAPPCDLSTSPLGKALEKGAKILHFGSPVATTTFIHMIEDACNVPFLNTAVCQECLADGGIKTVTIEKHLPGHRDFYCGFHASECKFFHAARVAGLELRKTTLGLGELCVMDAIQLFDIGKLLVEKDFRILLCDNPTCLFCNRYK